MRALHICSVRRAVGILSVRRLGERVPSDPPTVVPLVLDPPWSFVLLWHRVVFTAFPYRLKPRLPTIYFPLSF